MTNPSPTNPAAELIARSKRLGSDPRVTNYAGGNTSAKGTDVDPVTGEPVELLWVKGSGGDLGTLAEGQDLSLMVRAAVDELTPLTVRNYLPVLVERRIRSQIG